MVINKQISHRLILDFLSVENGLALMQIRELFAFKRGIFGLVRCG